MTATIDALYRFPVKGLSPERLDRVELQAGYGFPFDRSYAITDGTWSFDPANPIPVPKTKFLMLARYEQLMSLKTKLDEETRVLRVTTPDGGTHLFALEESTGRESASRFFAALMHGRIAGQPEVASALGHRFTDVSVHSPTLMQSVSLINLASVRALSAKLGQELDPIRFRGNIVVDSNEPWIEFAAMEREFIVGGARVRAIRRTRRCAATNVNPKTSVRDLNIPGALHEHFGHVDLGVYVEVLDGGCVEVGSKVLFPEPRNK